MPTQVGCSSCQLLHINAISITTDGLSYYVPEKVMEAVVLT